MMLTIVDDRNTEQKKSLTCLVGGYDSFMSGWGQAEGGASYAYWACKPEDEAHVRMRVSGRGDISLHSYDSIVARTAQNDHIHIYVCDESHVYTRGYKP